MKIEEVKRLLEENDLVAKKYFGQNFLVNDNILNKICDVSNIDENTNVIEIGPGLGSLTEVIAKKCKKLLCYEIDSDMVNILTNRLNVDDKSNIVIKNQDFLKADINEDIYTYFGDDDNIVVVANLPYYITTAILLKILEESNIIKTLTVMVQTEVAKRLDGKPATKDYNSLSVLVQYYMNTRVAINVSPSCFHPRPLVDSSVIMLQRKDRIEYEAINEDYFKKFNRGLFSMRRKTIVNNLSSYFGYSKDLVSSILIDNGFKKEARAEELSVKEIVKLSNLFYSHLDK